MGSGGTDVAMIKKEPSGRPRAAGAIGGAVGLAGCARALAGASIGYRRWVVAPTAAWAPRSVP